MNKKKKILSIITVVKNDTKNIEKTIGSILSQKNKIVEYLIIDGQSSDGTFEKINKFKKKIDIIIREKDKGIYDAMNKGIMKATGKYVGFCNSGDIIKKNGLSTILNYLSKDTDVLFATVKRNYTDSYIIKSGYNLARLNFNFDFATSHSTGFYIKKKLHKKYGFYDTKFTCSADYDFYYRLFKNNKIKILSTNKSKIIGEVKSGGYSSTLSPIEHLNEETKIRIKNKQSLILIIFIYLNALTKIFFKKVLTRAMKVIND